MNDNFDVHAWNAKRYLREDESSLNKLSQLLSDKYPELSFIVRFGERINVVGKAQAVSNFYKEFEENPIEGFEAYDYDDDDRKYEVRIFPKKKEINEISLDNIYALSGVLNISDDSFLMDILSHIRALPGITILNNRDLERFKGDKSKAIVDIKIDPYPYIKDPDFKTENTIKTIVDKIRKIEGVKLFKLTSPITTIRR